MDGTSETSGDRPPLSGSTKGRGGPPAAGGRPRSRDSTDGRHRGGSDDLTNKFAGWLYRPFVDLGPWKPCRNPITFALHMASKGLEEQRDDWVRENTGIPFPSFRQSLLRAIGASKYLVEDPRDVDPVDRTTSWQMLCAHLDAYDPLDTSTRIRVLRLLNRLHAAPGNPQIRRPTPPHRRKPQSPGLGPNARDRESFSLP